jgi:hypothetical protein
MVAQTQKLNIMLKLTVLNTKENCDELVQIELTHITVFKDNLLELHFISIEEMLKLINVFIKEYVKFTCEGKHIIYNLSDYQRVRLRFDAKSSK